MHFHGTGDEPPHAVSRDDTAVRAGHMR